MARRHSLCTACKGARGWLTDNGPAPTGWEDCPECGGDGLDHSAEARNPWLESAHVQAARRERECRVAFLNREMVA